MSARDYIAIEHFDLFEEASSSGLDEENLYLKKKYGSGKIRTAQVKKGFSYIVHDFLFKKDLSIITPQDWDASGKIWFDVCMYGNGSQIYKKRSFQMKSGTSDIFIGGYDISIKQQIKKNLPYRVVSVMFDFDSFFKITGRKPEDVFSLFSKAVPNKQILIPMRRAAEQIAEKNFSQVDKKLFIEAKLLELVSYKLGQLYNQPENPICKERKKFVERIHYAAEIIEQQMLEPPGIFDLAYEAGLNHNRLTKGFKDVFGVTPFAYLRKTRLKKAAELIASREQNVTEAAFSVGYTNLSNFAKIFRNEFGINPSEYHKSRVVKK